jgi:hypothetical protein
MPRPGVVQIIALLPFRAVQDAEPFREGLNRGSGNPFAKIIWIGFASGPNVRENGVFLTAPFYPASDPDRLPYLPRRSCRASRV